MKDLDSVSGGTMNEYGAFLEEMMEKYNSRDVDTVLSAMSDEEKTTVTKA